jgi:hypothetical protein
LRLNCRPDTARSRRVPHSRLCVSRGGLSGFRGLNTLAPSGDRGTQKRLYGNPSLDATPDGCATVPVLRDRAGRLDWVTIPPVRLIFHIEPISSKSPQVQFRRHQSFARFESFRIAGYEPGKNLSQALGAFVEVGIQFSKNLEIDLAELIHSSVAIGVRTILTEQGVRLLNDHSDFGSADGSGGLHGICCKIPRRVEVVLTKAAVLYLCIEP